MPQRNAIIGLLPAASIAAALAAIVVATGIASSIVGGKNSFRAQTGGEGACDNVDDDGNGVVDEGCFSCKAKERFVVGNRTYCFSFASFGIDLSAADVECQSFGGSLASYTDGETRADLLEIIAKYASIAYKQPVFPQALLIKNTCNEITTAFSPPDNTMYTDPGFGDSGAMDCSHPVIMHSGSEGGRFNDGTGGAGNGAICEIKSACCSPSGQCRQQLGTSCLAGETRFDDMAQCMAGCGAGSSSSASVCGAPTFSSYDAPDLFGISEGAALGPDGNLWYLEANGTAIRRMSPDGAIVGPAHWLLAGWQASDIVLGPDGHFWLAANAGILRVDPDDDGTAAPEFFTLPVSTLDASAAPNSIALGPDGNVWFTESDKHKIGRITPSGAITEYSIPTTYIGPSDIASGPDGNMWFTFTREEPGSNGGRIGRITPSGAITEYPAPIYVRPSAIAAGPDGNLWFTEGNAGSIGRITTGGVVTEFPLPLYNNIVNDIAAGPDGNLWFTWRKNGANKIGRITTSGVVTEFPLAVGSSPYDIAAGPDGNLWFTEFGANKIGRITPSGAITEYAIPTTDSAPYGIAAGPDGNLWFAEYGANKIGRITPSGVITEFPLPQR